MNKYRDAIDELVLKVNTYRNPTIDEPQALLSELLAAADLGSIEHDKIENIGEENGTLHIHTSWMVRQCSQTSDYELPSVIIDADNPVKAAKLWGLQRKMNESQNKINTLEKQLKDYRTELSNLAAARAFIL